ncbi:MULTISPECIES: hypothetical protein [unclassified Paraflavitalea]|uniref:hypothetical protein n=1 Tax=unclassified Paraflavitalea TaxID=2798305 RepID=UPI003D3441EC
MKKFLLILVCFLGLNFISKAQDDKKENSRIEALKIAFITRKLNLSPEEAQKFWPVYNRYTDEMRQIRQDLKDNKDELAKEEKILNIRKKFNGEFGKALNTDKVNEFFKAEREFNNLLQKEMLERRQQRMENRQRLRQQ